MDTYTDIDTDTLAAETIVEELTSQVDPRVLDKVLTLLERALRRISIQRILSEHDNTN
jgi:hypothetical protein